MNVYKRWIDVVRFYLKFRFGSEMSWVVLGFCFGRIKIPGASPLAERFDFLVSLESGVFSKNGDCTFAPKGGVLDPRIKINSAAKQQAGSSQLGRRFGVLLAYE